MLPLFFNYSYCDLAYNIIWDHKILKITQLLDRLVFRLETFLHETKFRNNNLKQHKMIKPCV